MTSSITTRIMLVVVLIHAVLLPVLYAGLGVVVGRSHAELFVQHVRTFARNLAEEMEIGDILDSPQRVSDFLDLAVTNGEGVYAELVDNGRSTKSSLGVADVTWPGRQDFGFGSSRDHLYFIALPVSREGHVAELRLGFDERPISAQIDRAMRRTLWALAAYLAVALALSTLFGMLLSRPIVELTRAARRIASGNYVQSLGSASGVRELHDLGRDLENMRRELVGINERLLAEIGERERAEVWRQELERRLQHRHRVETVGTLAGGIAHEINNALLPIMLLAESALAEVDPRSAARSDLEGILSSARRAKEIVVKVLMFSRDAGNVQLEPIDLESVVKEALRLFGLMAASTVELRVQLAGPYPPVVADAALTVQLIVNLCTNGYQAMSGQPGTLTVSLGVEEVAEGGAVPAGEHVVLAVGDTGHGMSPATLERIFEPFFTTREVGVGSGLGLAVVHGIVQSFGAAIVVESELGRGSVFRVYFPSAGHARSGAVDLAAGAGE